MASAGSRPSFSCVQCRQRKVRCDRKRQCSNCIRRGETCTWSAGAAPFFGEDRDDEGGRSEQSVADLQRRVARLERVIARSGLQRSPSPEPEPVRDPETSSSPSYGAHRRAVSNSLEESAGTLADLADLATKRGPQQLDVSMHDLFDHHILVGASQRIHRRQSASPTISPQSGLAAYPLAVASPLGSYDDLLDLLPSKERCDHLVDVYLDRVEWIHHPLHIPSFLSRYRRFWAENQRHESARWLALLFIVLCLGEHFDDGRSPAPTGVGHGEDETYYRASHSALAQSNFAAYHSMEALQTLVIMGLWLNNRDFSGLHHAHLGLAIRMATAMGLGRLDAPGADRREMGAVSREIGRRMWWSLTCQDWYVASSCQFSYSIHPDQVKTQMFSNVDDEELVDDRPIVSHDLRRTATSSSYHIAKVPFATSARRFVDLYNKGISYDAIASLESELRTAFYNLPGYLRYDVVPSSSSSSSSTAEGNSERRQLVWQRLFIGLTLHNRIMRLHRPFMARGYSDARYGHSKDATLVSAKDCLDLVRQARKVDFPGMRWWVVLVQIFTAAVALCIDLYCVGPHAPAVAEENRQYVQSAIEAMRAATNVSTVANRAVNVLTRLLEQGGKRCERVEQRRGKSRQGEGGEADGGRSGKRRRRQTVDGERAPLSLTVDEGVSLDAAAAVGGAGASTGTGTVSIRTYPSSDPATSSVAVSPTPVLPFPSASPGRVPQEQHQVGEGQDQEEYEYGEAMAMAASSSVPEPEPEPDDEWAFWDSLFGPSQQTLTTTGGTGAAELLETMNSFALGIGPGFGGGGGGLDS